MTVIELRQSGGPRTANKKSLPFHGQALHLFGYRGTYQTLFPQTLFPKKANSDMTRPRFEIRMYFIFFPPPMSADCFLGLTPSPRVFWFPDMASRVPRRSIVPHFF
jgi:hypothetical protein